MDNIDSIIYINLKHRTDRNSHILEEIKKICTDESKIHRIDALYIIDNGALGCSTSHISALEYILEHPEFNNCLILEDDFTFISDNIDENNSTISHFFKDFPNFDCCNLAFNDQCLKYTDTHIDNIKRIFFSLSSSAYIISTKFVPKLLENLKESVNDKIDNGNYNRNNLDVHWSNLMKISNWYITKPRLGYQYDNYSDIEKHDVVYGC